ncbi:MAG: hypothetical protein FJ404_18100 [Verrucomicrobia bacterium]|nr:hypothetical protein [Verrucomicrobiota bacterium]
METPLMPARQFALTDQVTEVTVQVGETYLMEAYGVVAQTAGEYTKSHFRDFDLRMSVDTSSPAGIAAREGRARFTSHQQDFQTFTFKPAAEDANRGGQRHLTPRDSDEHDTIALLAGPNRRFNQ